MNIRGDITGRRFGRLVALARVENASDGRPQWLCLCDCGKQKVVRSGSLKQGHTKSCGCLLIESAIAHAPLAALTLTRHGMSKTRLANIFKGMVQRCTNKKNQAYESYGGRGIAICGHWMSDRGSFFAWAITNGYHDGLTIDRIDNDLGYYPENCHWVNAKEQANNTRKNKIIEFEGRSMTLSEWARDAGMETRTLWQRLNSGWLFEKAITTPVRGTRR